MRFPLVTRAHHEEITGELRARLEEHTKRIAALEAERARLYDAIFQLNWGIQIHDSLPAAPANDETEPDEQENEEAATRARLTSIRRTRPSQLGAALTQEMRKNIVRRVHQANPARQMFAEAAAEVER